MRVTLVGYGSTGDMLPLVALAVALREADHEVVVLGDEAGAELAERHGIEFDALEGSLRETMRPGRPLALAIDAGRFTVKSFTDYDAHDQARLSLIQQVAQGSDLVGGCPWPTTTPSPPLVRSEPGRSSAFCNHWLPRATWRQRVRGCHGCPAGCDDRQAGWCNGPAG